MQTKRIRLANTVFVAESEFELQWGGNLLLFQTEDAADFTLYIRNANPGEVTYQADGYAGIEREGNAFQIVLSEKWSVQPTLWQILKLLPMSALLLERGVLTLHASYTCHKGEGIVFSGPSGVGKSTQSGLWARYRGAREINGDRVLLMPGDDGTMVASHYLSGTSGICENITSALKAIVLLEQAGENGIRPASALQMLRMLMGQIDYSVSDRTQLIRVSGLVEKMLKNTTLCRYGCRIDENAVDILEEYLYKM